LERGTLSTIPVQGLTYFRTLWVTYRRQMTFSHAATAFLEVLRQQAKTQLDMKSRNEVGTMNAKQ
jgi:hypothetical protein